MTIAVTPAPDPRRYFEGVGASLPVEATAPPLCVYLEVTNRCNLLCETCPRTFETLEPPADMSWDLFTGIVDQLPGLRRAVLHGVGEPMLVRDLPRMVRYLKDRGVYVLFNTNGTLLKEQRFPQLIASGLDELQVSLDAADAPTYALVRGKNFFDRIVRDVRRLTDYQKAHDARTPRVSLWLTGLKETVNFPRLLSANHPATSPTCPGARTDRPQRAREIRGRADDRCPPADDRRARDAADPLHPAGTRTPAPDQPTQAQFAAAAAAKNHRASRLL